MYARLTTNEGTHLVEASSIRVASKIGSRVVIEFFDTDRSGWPMRLTFEGVSEDNWQQFVSFFNEMNGM